jgi:hypothetical protein
MARLMVNVSEERIAQVFATSRVILAVEDRN